MTTYHPLKIILKNGAYKAVTSLEKLGEKPKNIRYDLSYIEIDYAILVKLVKEYLASRPRRADPRILWSAGDNILCFLARVRDLGFYLVQQNKTLARDIGVSESTVKRVLSFKRRFPSVSMIDPNIPWNTWLTKSRRPRVP